MKNLVDCAPPAARSTPSSRARRRSGIERTTPLVAAAVAHGVWSETCVWLGEELPRSWIARLVVKAETVYANNTHFRALLRRPGDIGRDWLWAFSRHWLAALLKRHRPALYARLPGDYSRGHPLPPARE